MLKSKMCLLSAGALVGVALAATGPARSANVELGDWNVQIDNTVSVGLSMMMKDPDAQFLPISNGGVGDGSVYGGVNAATGALASGSDQGGDYVPGVLGAMDACDESYGAYCQEILAVPNFDGSINNDDGRLNFEKGDIYSAPVRLTTEVEANNGPFTIFGRLNLWHDITANDEDSFNRGGSIDDDGDENMGQDIELLDAFVSYDGDLSLAGLDMPFSIRAGRQVINWGEATFVPGGNSVFNPIDVAQLRRPGAQIKEALLPVEALYGSIAITQDIPLRLMLAAGMIIVWKLVVRQMRLAIVLWMVSVVGQITRKTYTSLAVALDLDHLLLATAQRPWARWVLVLMGMLLLTVTTSIICWRVLKLLLLFLLLMEQSTVQTILTSMS